MWVTPAGTVQVPAALTPLTQSAAMAWPATPKQATVANFASIGFFMFFQ
jgi:hypothetical protein